MPEILTQKHVDAVLRSTTRVELTDAKTTGLVLRGKATGVTWVFRSNKGRSENVRRTLGSYPGMSLAQARQMAQAANDRVRGGLVIDEVWLAERRVALGVQDAMPDVMPASRIRSKSWVYEEAVAAYISSLAASRKPATIKNYREKLTHPAIRAAFYGKPVSEIERVHVARIIADLGKDHTTLATDLVGHIRRLWDYMSSDAVRTESGVAENTMLGLKAPARPLDRPVGVHIKNPAMPVLGLLLVTCRSDVLHPTIARALEIATLTAQRRETVANALVEDVDLRSDPPTWKIGGRRMKMALDHHIPLSDRAAAVFEAAIADACGDAWVFPQARPAKEGGPMTHVHVDTLSHYTSYVTGGVTPHRLRIAFTSSCGLSDAEAAVILDHMEGRKTVTSKRYNRDHKISLKVDYLTRWEAALRPHVVAAQASFDPAEMQETVRQRKKAAQSKGAGGPRKRGTNAVMEKVKASIAAATVEREAQARDRTIIEQTLEALAAGTLSPDEAKRRLRLD